MMSKHEFKMKKALVFTFSVIALTACGSTDHRGDAASRDDTYDRSVASSSRYGVIQSIEMVEQENASSDRDRIGVGTVAGAVIGGLVGSQLGNGRGNTAATIAGAAGGAYAGHQIEKGPEQRTEVYKFTVRMNDGSFQTLNQNSSADFRVGDRVQIESGLIRRY